MKGGEGEGWGRGGGRAVGGRHPGDVEEDEDEEDADGEDVLGEHCGRGWGVGEDGCRRG